MPNLKISNPPKRAGRQTDQPNPQDRAGPPPVVGFFLAPETRNALAGRMRRILKGGEGRLFLRVFVPLCESFPRQRVPPRAASSRAARSDGLFSQWAHPAVAGAQRHEGRSGALPRSCWIQGAIGTKTRGIVDCLTPPPSPGWPNPQRPLTPDSVLKSAMPRFVFPHLFARHANPSWHGPRL
jgi:hypothetical protein